MPVQSTYLLYIAFNLLNSLLLLPVTIWHYWHNNASAAALGTWFFITLQLVTVNGIIWHGDNEDRAPAFCDISVKVEGACSFGTVISAFYVAQGLAAAVRPNAGIRGEVSRRQALKEYALYFGLPLLLMGTQPLYQYGRYQIIEHLGCRRFAQNNFYFVYIQILLPVYIILAAAGYMFYASVRVWMYRLHLQKISANAGMPTARFVRIICVCWTYIGFALVFFVVGGLETVLNKSIGWTSSMTVRAKNFDQVFRVPRTRGPTFQEWDMLLMTVPYTVFFGFSPEMLDVYGRFINKYRKTKPAAVRSQIAAPVAPLGQLISNDSSPAMHDISLEVMGGSVKR